MIWVEKMNKNPKIIFSTIGTSIITNRSKDKIGLINQYSNEKIEDKIPKELIQFFSEIKTNIENDIKNSKNIDKKTLKKWSAEINGLINIYEKYERDLLDIHYLITTDTFFGKIVSEIFQSFIEEYFGVKNIVILQPSGLRASNTSDFHSGITTLLKEIESLELNKYKKQHYQIIFNLVGGFKSVQAYLTTIGMFYADKIVYIFETGEELLEIPKLPIRLDDKYANDYPILFLLLEESLKIEQKEDPIFQKIKEIPEVLYEGLENQYWLSPWGILYWYKNEEEVLRQKETEIFKEVHDLFEFTENFKKDYKSIGLDIKKKVVRSIIKIYKFYLENNKNFNFTINTIRKHEGIRFDEIKINPGYYHFRIDIKRRITCTLEDTKITLHRIYEDHDKAITNP